MKSSVFLEKILGQEAIYKEITDTNISKKYLISASIGQGKHYLIVKLKKFFQNDLGTYILHLSNHNLLLECGQDYAPFVDELTKKEHTTLDSLVNLGKNSVEFIPKVGKFISQVLKSQRVFPVQFSNTEIELLIRIERIIGMKKVLFLCEEIDCWDQMSLRFLQKIFSYTFGLPSRKIIFVCTCTTTEKSLISESYFDQHFKLQCIQKQYIHQVLKILVPDHSLTESTIEKIHQLSGGNIGIILELITLIEVNNSNLVNLSLVYRDITLQRLKGILNEFRYKQAVVLLDRASLIGISSYRKLLFLFTKYDVSAFTNSLSDVIKNDILKEYVDRVSFNNHSVWQAFYIENCKNQKFHYELAACIKQLMPSNYSYIGNELIMAEQQQEAVIYYILAALHEYQTYRVKPTLLPEQVALIKKFCLYDSYKYLEGLYTSYFMKDYSEILQADLRMSDYRLRFELDYIRSLVYINGFVKQSIYTQTLCILESWVEDESFRGNSPYQWMKAALLALEVQYELHDKSLNNLLKQIEKTKRYYIDSDSGMERLEFDFLSKCNFCYMVDTAYHYTKQAVKYFKEHLVQSPSKYPLYIALINSAANALVVGKYQESLQFSNEALVLAENGCSLYGAADALVNNLVIAALLDGKLQTPEEIEACIIHLKQFISKASDSIITEILLRNNIAVMMCYKGDFLGAVQEINQLYNEIQYIDDLDDYYHYIVGNNTCILNYIMGSTDFNYKQFGFISKLRPLDHDHSYFTARNQYILEQVNGGTLGDLTKSTWNDFKNQKIGPAWSFWGKWLLFSDLQIWST